MQKRKSYTGKSKTFKIWKTLAAQEVTYLCTSMKNSPSKVMSSGTQRECKEDGAQLKLHRDKTENSL